MAQAARELALRATHFPAGNGTVRQLLFVRKKSKGATPGIVFWPVYGDMRQNRAVRIAVRIEMRLRAFIPRSRLTPHFARMGARACHIQRAGCQEYSAGR